MINSSNHIENVYQIIKELSETVGPISFSFDSTGGGDPSIEFIGDITGNGTSPITLTIPDSSINYNKIQNTLSSSILLGRGDSSAGELQEISLSGLTMVGTTLTVSGGAGLGTVVGPFSSVNNSICLFDGTSGELIKESVIIIDSTGFISGVTKIDIEGGYSTGPGNGISIGEHFGPGGISIANYVLIGNLISGSSFVMVKDTSSGTSSAMYFTSDYINKWVLFCDGNDTGGDNGSDLTLQSFDDSGTLSNVFIFKRDITQVLQFYRDIDVSGNITANNLSGNNSGDNAANSSTMYIGTTAVALMFSFLSQHYNG